MLEEPAVEDNEIAELSAVPEFVDVRDAAEVLADITEDEGEDSDPE